MSSATEEFSYDPELTEWSFQRPVTPPIRTGASLQLSPPPSPRERTIGCAVCISNDRFHSAISSINPSAPGTMRCSSHTLRCASCADSVESDTQLLCSSCELSPRGVEVLAILDGTSSTLSWSSNRMCVYNFFPLQTAQRMMCGCVSCIAFTNTFFHLRAMEEGLASSPTTETTGFRP